MAVPKPHFDQQGVRDFIYDGYLTLTPLQAKLVLANCQFEGQRPISPQQVAILADEMKRGVWTPRRQINFAIVPDGRYLLVNGYHRMHAQIQAGKSIEWQVNLQPVKNVKDLGDFYNTFDTVDRKRGSTDIIRASGFAERASLSGDAARLLYAAMPFIASRFIVSAHSRDYLTNAQADLRIAMATRYIKPMQSFMESIHGTQPAIRAKLRSSGMTAVAIVTFLHQPETAWKFWQGAAQNDGLKKGDARRAFITALLARKPEDANDRQLVLAQPILAWNAFFEDREVERITVPKLFVPAILGTPFDGTPPVITAPKAVN